MNYLELISAWFATALVIMAGTLLGLAVLWLIFNAGYTWFDRWVDRRPKRPWEP